MLTELSPAQVNERVLAGKARLVDIREPEEYTRLSIPSAFFAPLSVLPQYPLPASAEETIFFCNSGNRTNNNANMLSATIQGKGYQMAGGIQAWKQAGLPIKSQATPLPLFRQIQIGAGGLVLLGMLLSLLWPAALWLSAFVGAGLVFAGISGFCGLGLLLQKMPWNTKRSIKPSGMG